MASSLRRLGSHSSNAYRFVCPQLISRFSTDALSVEYKAGEIGTVSGIPDEHLQRRVLIYSPARTASQQGAGKVGRWKINFLSTQKWENPLMGWTSTGDPYANVGDSALSFESEADAKGFAERHGWDYTVKKHQTPLLKIRPQNLLPLDRSFSSTAGPLRSKLFLHRRSSRSKLFLTASAPSPVICFSGKMASPLCRLGGHSSNADRFVFRQLINRFSTYALCDEYKAGEVGTVCGIPGENIRMRAARTASRSLCTATGTQSQKLERIADEILSLTKLERHDYAVLLRYKMGFNNYGPAVTGIGSASSGPDSAGPGSDAKAAEKVVFDVKIDKYDAASKIKIIKEVRAFTDLGLKEAKDLVEKVPVVVKKGITKDEAESIMAKLKDLGATVVLE